MRDAFCFGDGRHGFAFDRLDIDLVELVHELLAVFGVDNCLHGRSQDLHAVFFEHAALVEFDAAVQRRLAAECEQDALRPLPGDHLLDEFGRNG